jgi:chromatin assembly factor 1 subunit B
MFVNTLEVAWAYELENLNSIDFHPTQNLLLVGSSDSSSKEIYLRLWSFEEEIFQQETDKNKKSVILLQELTRGHSLAVNCVSFSPTGNLFASGSDDYRVIIWQEDEK